MMSLLRFVGLLLVVDAAVIGQQGAEGEVPGKVAEHTATARLTEFLRAARPSVLLQKIVDKADPKMDKDLPVVHVGPTTDKEIKELIDQEQSMAWAHLRTLIFVFAVYSLTVLGCAAIYAYLWKDPQIEIQAESESDDFQFGICNFFEDMHVTFLAFCCLPCRWADTMNASGLLGFWAAFLLFIVISHLRSWAQNYDVVLGVVAWLAAALVFTYYRQQLRKLFAIRNESTDQVKDFALWACCCCCAAAQEARQVRAAGKATSMEA